MPDTDTPPEPDSACKCEPCPECERVDGLCFANCDGSCEPPAE